MGAPEAPGELPASSRHHLCIAICIAISFEECAHWCSFLCTSAVVIFSTPAPVHKNCVHLVDVSCEFAFSVAISVAICQAMAGKCCRESFGWCSRASPQVR